MRTLKSSKYNDYLVFNVYEIITPIAEKFKEDYLFLLIHQRRL